MNQVSRDRATVIKKIEETNNTIEKTKVNLPLLNKESAIGSFEEKIQEITKCRDELLSIVEGINDKYEKMKKFK